MKCLGRWFIGMLIFLSFGIQAQEVSTTSSPSTSLEISTSQLVTSTLESKTLMATAAVSPSLSTSDTLNLGSALLSSTLLSDSNTSSQVLDSLAAPKKPKRKRLPPVVIRLDTIMINNYKKIHHDGRVEVIDTSLHIQKDYRFNTLRKDLFERLRFPNVGEAYNRLGYDFSESSYMPHMGARARHDNYMEVEDILYFQVPTPYTELFFKTTFEQGQLVDALVTLNTSPGFNLFIGHKGLRSLGKYVSSKSTGTQFRMGGTYDSRGDRYHARFHFAAQRLDNQINGGLTEEGEYYFENAPTYMYFDRNGEPYRDENGDPYLYEYDGYLDRSRMDLQTQGSNMMRGKRYFLDHHLNLFPVVRDSVPIGHRFQVQHQLTYETKGFNFVQSKRDTDFFGETVNRSSIDNLTTHRSFQQKLTLKTLLPGRGSLTAGLHQQSWEMGFGPIVEAEADTIPNLKGSQYGLEVQYQQPLGPGTFQATAYKTFKEAFAADALTAAFEMTVGQSWYLHLEAQQKTLPIALNFYRSRSNYEAFNWSDQVYDKQNLTAAKAQIKHQRFGQLQVQYQRIQDYVFFSNTATATTFQEQLIAAPEQLDGHLNYLKVRLDPQYEFWKMGIYASVQYQKVTQEATRTALALNVPEWLGRATVAFKFDMFRKALQTQLGATAHYFTAYNADQYHPILGEFINQNQRAIGNFPRIDLFFNAKIQKTRFFLKWEHMNSHQTGYDYYAAPMVPYRDAIIRFGLVWDFFD